MRRYTPEQAQIFVVDYRRALLGEIPDELPAATTSPPRTRPTRSVAELAAYLRSRLPGPDVTPEQLRDRSWWTGAEVFVLVDDYDLVVDLGRATRSRRSSPLLAAGRRRRAAPGADPPLRWCVAGAYEPVMQTLRDLGTPGILLSGSPDEGPLIGNIKAVPAVARPRPPRVARDRQQRRPAGVDAVAATGATALGGARAA